MKKRLFARKTLALAMAALMAAGALTGCSSGSKETAAAGDTTAAPAAGSEAAGSEAAGGSGEAVTVKFRYWADNTDYSALMQDIIKKFNAENGKGITVVCEETPWDGGAYSENLFNAKMGGGDIDCATWKLTSTPLFVNNDLLADLTPLVDSWDKKLSLIHI